MRAKGVSLTSLQHTENALVRKLSLRLIVQEEVVASLLLFAILDRVELVDTRAEVGRITSERDVQLPQELVHTREQRIWGMSSRLRSEERRRGKEGGSTVSI